MTAYHFIIVDDHPLFRDALRLSLSGMFDGLKIDEAEGLDDVIDKLNSSSAIDLVLLDLYMPGVQGFSGLMFLRAQFPDVPVVIVSANDEPQVMRRSLDFGASGYIPKSLGVEDIRIAVRQVLEGQIWTPPDLDLSVEQNSEDAEIAARLATLTPQQVRVLMMLSQGLLNKQIAYELGVSEATVKAHVSAILQKLGVDSRTQAVIAAHRIGSGQWQELTE